MKIICESWINESRTGSSEPKVKSDHKLNTILKRNPLALKTKIECLICSQKKNRLNSNRKYVHNKFISESSDYENDFYGSGNANNNLCDYVEDDICKKNNLNFYDGLNYYKYNNNDIKNILSFPNVNDSFAKLESSENINNKNFTGVFNRETNKNAFIDSVSNSNLINLDLVENINNHDSNAEFNINRNNIKVKTLYSNEDISIKYNYILKKLI
jgi:hypothetical protein